MAKGRTQFTIEEYKTICELVYKKVRADRKEQKSIRDKLRGMGLYWSEVGEGKFTVENLNKLFNKEVLKIKGVQTNDPLPEMRIAAPAGSTLSSGPDVTKKESTMLSVDSQEIEKKLIEGKFMSVPEAEYKIPNVPGLYCIKLKNGVELPEKFGTIREDGIIYIGIASKSLKERLWEEELNHKRAATFFRSIGAMLGYLPPKGSLVGKSNTRNYRFNSYDTQLIKKWMKDSLLVNFVKVSDITQLEKIEKDLIRKYTPLVNIKGNPCASEALKEARRRCEDIANKLD